MQKTDKFILLWQYVSTVSTGGAVRMLIETGTNDSIAINAGFVLGLAIGGTFAFKVIPYWITANTKKSRKRVFITGTILSLTYPLNAVKIHNSMVEYKASEINARYELKKEEYKSYIVSSYSKDKNVAILQKKYDSKALLLEEEEEMKSVESFKTKRTLSLGNYKSSHSKKEYKKYYEKLARKKGCRIPTSFNRLVKCVSKVEYNQYKSIKNEKIAILRKDAKKALIALNSAKTQDDEKKAKSQEDNKKVALLKKEIEQTKAKAKTETISIYILAFFLWMFGLFVEVFIVGFDMLKNIWEEEAVLEKTTSKIEEVKKELNEITETYQKTLHNHEGMDLLIDFANNKNSKLRKMLLWKKGPKKGKIIAIANSIAGAFLYVYTIKKNDNESIDSWKKILQSDLLFVNGRNGTEYVLSEGNKKTKRLKLIESYTCSITQQEILCLGSTAETLQVKTFGKITPQKEAIDFLIAKEDENPHRYAPQNCKKTDIESLIISFVKNYYPNNFKEKV